VAQRHAQQLAKPSDGVHNSLVIALEREHRNRVECIEEEMRLELGLQDA
jgi:hypothetical protein